MGNTHRGAWGLRLAAAGLVALSLGSCGIFGGGGGPITVGAVTFAENQIVAEIYAQVLENAGHDVERRFNFPRREELYPELAGGEVDIAPEYLASLHTFLEPDATASAEASQVVDDLEPLVAEDGLELLQPSDANDTNAFVVTAETAERFDLERVSDLAGVAERLTFGGPPECPERRYCLAGLGEVYDVRFKDFRELDTGGPLTIAALSSGEIDVALMFSTSSIIEERGWVVLDDDRGLQAAENITPVVRSDVVDAELARLLNRVSAELTTSNITQLNARVELRNEDVADVAEDFLGSNGLAEG